MKNNPHEKAGCLREFERLCRERGLAVTVQRRVIYEAVLAHLDHPTADEVFASVRRKLPNISRTTVYRVLERFVSMGLIGKPSHPGSVARYDKSTTRHHHLVCIRCERTMDLEDPALDGLQLPDTRRLGFAIADFSVHFTGLCADCRRTTTETGRDRTLGMRRAGRRKRFEDS